MQLSRQDLYRIIVEEYTAEEGIVLSEDKVDDLLAWVKGGEKPDWVDDENESPEPPEVPPAPEAEPPADDTMPFPVDEPTSIEDQIAALVQGLPPEEVADVFQAVFGTLPGVELGDAEDEPPETLYSPGAEGRPQVGFKLEELMTLIREVMSEGHYHDMGGDAEMYNVLDPHGFENYTDAEIIIQARKDGLEEIIVVDGEGDLANREEVIAAMKDV